MQKIENFITTASVLWSKLFSAEWRTKEHNFTKAKRAKIEIFAQVQTNVLPREERHRFIGLTVGSSESLCAGREFSVVL